MLPRLIELQISGTSLATMVLNRARTQVFFSPDPIQLTNPGDGIVDHIAFDDAPSVVLSPTQSNVQTVQIAGGGTAILMSKKVRFRLGLRIFLKFIAVAKDPNNAVDDYALLPAGIPTTLSLDLSMSGLVSPELCLEVADLTSSLTIPQLTAALEKIKVQLQSAGPLCVPFDISSLFTLLGPIQAQNAVMAAQVDSNENVTAVAFRIEIGSTPADTESNWHDFVSGFQNNLSADGPDWNILIDPQTITDLTLGKIQSGLKSLSGFTMDGNTTGSWVTPGAFNGGQITFSDDGHFSVSECPNQIGVTISGTLDLQFSGGQLVEHGFIDWDLADSDVIACGFTLGGPLGLIIGTVIAPGIGTVVGAAIGAIVGAVVVGIIASVMSGNKTIVGTFSAPSCSAVDQHHFNCSTDLVLPPIDFGNGVNAALAVTSMIGLANGLLLGGTVAVARVGDPKFNMSQPDDAEPIGIIGDCFNFQPGYSFQVQLDCSGPSAAVYGPDLQPAIEVLNDPLNVFNYLINPDFNLWLPLTLDFNITIAPDQYFADPYRPILYVRTTSGAHSVLLPELLSFTKAKAAQIMNEILAADINCNKQASRWLGQPGAFNPHWAVDPGPEGDINIWEIFVGNIGVAEKVSAQTMQGVQLASAAARGVYAQLSVAVSGTGGRLGGDVPLTFTRTAEPSTVGALDARMREKKPVTAIQRSLRRRSVWSALGGSLRRATLGVYQNRISAFLVGTRGVEIINLQTPGRPTLAGIVLDADGAIPFYSGLLTWNQHGLRYDGRGLIADGQIEVVVTSGGCLYALTRTGVLIFNSRLEQIGNLLVAGATGMIATGNKLVLADVKGLHTFVLLDPEKPLVGPSFPLEGVRTIENLAVGGFGRMLLELRHGQSVVVDVAGDNPYIAATYFQRPWFAGAVTLRDVTLRPAGAGNIEVFTPGTKKMVAVAPLPQR